MKREPVVIANLVLAALVAVVGVLSAFDVWTPTGPQLAALSTLYIGIAAVVIYIARGQTYSPASVQTISDAVELVRTAPDSQAANHADDALSALLPPPTFKG